MFLIIYVPGIFFCLSPPPANVSPVRVRPIHLLTSPGSMPGIPEVQVTTLLHFIAVLLQLPKHLPLRSKFSPNLNEICKLKGKESEIQRDCTHFPLLCEMLHSLKLDKGVTDDGAQTQQPQCSGKLRLRVECWRLFLTA